MAAKTGFFSRYRLKYRPASPVLKIVVLVTAVLCTAALLSLRYAIRLTDRQTQQYQSQAAQVQRENDRLNSYMEMSGTVQGVKRIAMEQFGLADPGTEIYDIQD